MRNTYGQGKCQTCNNSSKMVSEFAKMRQWKHVCETSSAIRMEKRRYSNPFVHIVLCLILQGLHYFRIHQYSQHRRYYTMIHSFLCLQVLWDEMVSTACKMAVEARKDAGKEDEVLIAGSLSPLHGSYKPNQVQWSHEREMRGLDFLFVSKSLRHLSL